jgi:hypothetical protein
VADARRADRLAAFAHRKRFQIEELDLDHS